jgi:hypothetical protein
MLSEPMRTDKIIQPDIRYISLESKQWK